MSPVQMRDALISQGYITMAGDVLDMHGLYTYAAAQGWTTADIDAAMMQTTRFTSAPPPPPPPPPPPSLATNPNLTSWGNDTSPVQAPGSLVGPAATAAPIAPMGSIAPGPSVAPAVTVTTVVPNGSGPAAAPVTGPGGGVMIDGTEMFYATGGAGGSGGAAQGASGGGGESFAADVSGDTPSGVYTMSSGQGAPSETEGGSKALYIGAAVLLLLALASR